MSGRATFAHSIFSPLVELPRLEGEPLVWLVAAQGRIPLLVSRWGLIPLEGRHSHIPRAVSGRIELNSSLQATLCPSSKGLSGKKGGHQIFRVLDRGRLHNEELMQTVQTPSLSR